MNPVNMDNPNNPKRRAFLKNTGAAVSTIALGGVASTLSGCGNAVAPQTTAGEQARLQAGLGQLTWNNWSEGQTCHPQAILTPTSEAELAQIIRSAPNVRFVGSGHSFMPLVCTEQTIVSLDPLAGVMAHDAQKVTATVLGGTKLSQLARDLEVIGQETINLPDVLYQSLAGAISTATHGTGKDTCAMHHYATQIKLMTADGQILTCNAQENAEVWSAAQVSLGALGAITEVTLQNRPARQLHRKVWVQTLQSVLRDGATLFEQLEHFELLYLPHTGFCILISHTPYEGEIEPRLASKDDDGLNDLKQLRDKVPAFLRPLFARFLIKDGEVLEEAKDQSWRVLAQPRPSKFNESEYHIPKEHGFACFERVCAAMDQLPNTYYPIEFRLTKGDDAWLSPFYQRDCHSIAVHASHVEPYDYLISTIGPIFKHFGGRPHWGKLNDLGFKELAELYPRWQDFLRIRAQLDPRGKFVNDYTRRIFNLA